MGQIKKIILSVGTIIIIAFIVFMLAGQKNGNFSQNDSIVLSSQISEIDTREEETKTEQVEKDNGKDESVFSSSMASEERQTDPLNIEQSQIGLIVADENETEIGENFREIFGEETEEVRQSTNAAEQEEVSQTESLQEEEVWGEIHW